MLKDQKIRYYNRIREALIIRYGIDKVSDKADKTYVDEKIADVNDSIDTLIEGEDLVIEDAITAWDNA